MMLKRAVLVIIIGFFCISLVYQDESANKLKNLEFKLANAIHKKNKDEVVKIVREIVQINNADAAKAILGLIQSYESKKFWSGFMDGYSALIFYLGEFTDSGALAEIAKFILNAQGNAREIAKDILKAVTPSNTTVGFFEYILLNGNDSLKEMSIKKLKSIRVNKSIRALVGALKNEEIVKNKNITRLIISALYHLTDINLGSVEAWLKWAEKNQNFEPPPVKSRELTGTATDTITDPEDLPPIDKNEIVVLYVKCDKYGEEVHNFDKISDLLDKMQIPYIKVSLEEFEDSDFSMDDKLVLLVNCYDIRELCHGDTCTGSGGGFRGVGPCQGPGPHNPRFHSLTKKGIEKIKKFVAKGGYFFCEDWNAQDILNRAFPEFIKTKGDVRDMKSKFIPSSLWDKDVKIIPAKGAAGHPYLKRIFEKDPEIIGDTGGTTVEIRSKEMIEHTWRLDQYAPLLEYRNVEILIVSPQLGEETLKVTKGKECLDAVAMTFAYGRGSKETDPTDLGGVTTDYSKLSGGRVLYVLSHFGKQNSAQDKYTVQNLVLNFIAEAKHRKIYSKNKRKIK